MSELFDVVDEQDRVLRQETRTEVHRQRLLHRAVHILVFNARGEVYLQRRSARKDTYPNCWTTSCSGHVDAGEDYDVAAVRELAEELGLRGVKVAAESGEQGAGSSKPGDKEIQNSNHAGLQTPNSSQGTSDSDLPAPGSQLPAITPFLKHGPCRETGWEFIWIYTFITDTEPTPDSGEISEGRWISPADFDAWLLREPKAFTPSFHLVWKLWRDKKS